MAARCSSECTRRIAESTCSSDSSDCALVRQSSCPANEAARRAAAAASSLAGSSGCGIPGGGRCCRCRECSITLSRRPASPTAPNTSQGSILGADSRRSARAAVGRPSN
eukprot:scaffold74617_cov34-Tisochrysis_lutea.AAC.1